jgi:DEAD/DEAH box helicase domain-containing protein
MFVITTSTASGKTLGFLLPIQQEILNNRGQADLPSIRPRALPRTVPPSGAASWSGSGEPVPGGEYDGDTQVNERSRIRNNANNIQTNPYMLNTAIFSRITRRTGSTFSFKLVKICH